MYNDNFPRSLNMTKKKLLIRKPLHSYFIYVGSNFASKIPSSNANFESYFPNITTSNLRKPLK